MPADVSPGRRVRIDENDAANASHGELVSNRHTHSSGARCGAAALQLSFAPRYRFLCVPDTHLSALGEWIDVPKTGAASGLPDTTDFGPLDGMRITEETDTLIPSELPIDMAFLLTACNDPQACPKLNLRTTAPRVCSSCTWVRDDHPSC